MHDQPPSSFVGMPISIRKEVNGLGKGEITFEGTVCWTWDNNSSTPHVLTFPNTLYCASPPYCLLSP
jgi:hypothetical protein